MPKLREIQEQFAKHLQGLATDPDIAEQVKFNQLQNRQRLQVYQNNFKLSLTSNLASIYPVIEKLVGEQFFNYACNEFISLYPSLQGNLHEYGSEFSDFLSDFEPARSLAYLPDMAKFEWAYHRVFHEADSKPLDLERLQDINEVDYENIVFSLNPATRLMTSRFPLIDIWQANQSDEPPEIKLRDKNYYFLIGRRNYENIFQTLDQIEYQFLVMVQAKNKLGEISNVLTENFTEEQVDLNQLLVKNVTLGNISDFELA